MGNLHVSLQQQTGIDQRLSQRLMMSPQMQQALQCLQLPIMELSQLITQEMETNPLLELDEEDFSEPALYRTASKKQGNVIENLLIYAPTLRDILQAQVLESFSEKIDRELGAFIVDNLSENGLLEISTSEIATLSGYSEGDVMRILKVIQTMEPAGIGARSIQESFLLQLERKNLEGAFAYKIIKDYYDDLLHNRLSKIKKATGCSGGELEQTIKKEIATLELHPGLNYVGNLTQGIVPDVVVVSEEGIFRVEVTDHYSHRLHLNNTYIKLFEDPSIPVETKNFIKEKLQSVKWLMKNISQRNSTLQKIAEELIRLNHEYFSVPEGKLTPLTMKQLADILELHESTIARAVSSKYLSCDRGTISMKTFFTKGYRTDRGEHISSKTIQEKLKKLIGEEDSSSPLSDEALSKLLKEQGISCARRTVAKYRDAMGIGSTKYR